MSVVQFAQAKEPAVPAAPVPAAIVNAKKIFISYTGGDDLDGSYSGGSARCYNQFYAAMNSWGRYELVYTPADADLIFQIGFSVPAGFVNGPASQLLIGGGGGQVDFEGSVYVYDPQFRILILDPKTLVPLWGFTEHAGWAVLAGNRNRNFDQALNRIVSDVKSLAGNTGPGGRP